MGGVATSRKGISRSGEPPRVAVRGDIQPPRWWITRQHRTQYGLRWRGMPNRPFFRGLTEQLLRERSRASIYIPFRKHELIGEQQSI